MIPFDSSLILLIAKRKPYITITLSLTLTILSSFFPSNKVRKIEEERGREHMSSGVSSEGSAP